MVVNQNPVPSTAFDMIRDGLEIRPAIISFEQIKSVAAEVSLDSEVFRTGGVRNLEKRFDSIATLAADAALLATVRQLLGGPPRLVRALFFDKTPAKNWFAPGIKTRL